MKIFKTLKWVIIIISIIMYSIKEKELDIVYTKIREWDIIRE
jgi:hypothetical protein